MKGKVGRCSCGGPSCRWVTVSGDLVVHALIILFAYLDFRPQGTEF